MAVCLSKLFLFQILGAADNWWLWEMESPFFFRDVNAGMLPMFQQMVTTLMHTCSTKWIRCFEKQNT